MKSAFRTILFIITIAFCGVSAYAQKDNRQRMPREQLAETQAKYITKEMVMDDATAEKFVKAFCQFQKEVWALGPRPKRDSSNRSEAETEQALEERFAHSQKILNLRKKYYIEYSKFLTPKQIEQVYKLEKEIMDRLYYRSQKRKTYQK